MNERHYPRNWETVDCSELRCCEPTIHLDAVRDRGALDDGVHDRDAFGGVRALRTPLGRFPGVLSTLGTPRSLLVIVWSVVSRTCLSSLFDRKDALRVRGAERIPP